MSLITAAVWRQFYPQLTGTAEDSLIGSFIDRADGLMAGFCGFRTNAAGVRTLVASDYDLFYDTPGSRIPGILCLGARPIVSVDTVTASGVVLVEDVDFMVDLERGRLGLLSTGARTTWPVGFQAIEVTFNAGWGTTPPDLVAACAAEVRHLWDLRNTQEVQQLQTFGDSASLTDRDALIPASVQQALAPYRVC